MPLFNLFVGMCVRVCDIGFVLFTDYESCTRPISTNPISMEAGEHELTRETCFSRGGRVRRLLRRSWCVLGGVDFFVFFFLF